MARIGEVIDGKYEIEREIARGGMSVIYRAQDLRLGKLWAIKEFRKDKNDADREAALKALRQEANIMKRLDHPTVVRVVDIIESPQTLYVVMDYIEGESLNKVLDNYGAQPQQAVIEWAKQISSALDYMHSQTPPVIHRDIKPANIMLKPDGTVRLIDFGIAREYKEGQAGDTVAMGTRGYAAPEAFNGSQTDARTDIYSLGVTLYHLVTGQNPAEPPYEIYPIRHWNPELSSGLEFLIQKCTQLNPEDRFQSCAEIIYVLDNLPKYEQEYRKSLTRRINIFLVSTGLTLLFALGSIGCFVGESRVQAVDYNTYIAENTVDGYARAIESDGGRVEGYVKLIEKLREEVTAIVPGGKAEGAESLSGGVVTEEELGTWFSNANLEKLRQSDFDAYVSVNYELGRLYWNYYQGASGNALENARAARKYFEGVINGAANDPQRAGLSQQKYNLARAYFLVSYFQVNRAELSQQDDGGFKASEAARLAGVYGVDDNGMLTNPYYSYWHTCKDLLNFLGAVEEDVSDRVRLESISRLAYILNENYANFYNQTKSKQEKVDATEMQEMYRLFEIALNNIDVTEENEQQLQQVKDSLNSTARLIEQTYHTTLEVIR